ncbi:TolC family protein [Mucilaginibacter sp. KACC 22063]|uniref:TolC family protein n=1 Tax=Mucilaginibacter sp. KACC 22063 TaxID=3025666 RepID=UPI002366EE85|nr:TolC family protein [Mucilaginibacter sp. KACC 22063]WDF56638.1 TolC family protein [Mucilaginibacter sp. KACC 22063]
MLNNYYVRSTFTVLILLFSINGYAQQALSMKDAVRIGLENYPAIKAKANQLNASKAYLSETRTEYLPDLNLSGQQDYGTINGTNGPLYGYRGLSVASSGPALPNQNWNAAFGALYLANINWDFFAFGRAKDKIGVQKNVVVRDQNDYNQELFQHEVRVASAYLNLLAAQRIVKSQQDNLNRAQELRRVVVARVSNGLNPGVDSSLANAEVSNAKIALTNAQQTESNQSNQLAQYLGLPPQGYLLDSAFVTGIPKITDPQPAISLENHPLLKYYQSRIGVSDSQAKYYSKQALPTFSLFGVYQGRGSGFKSDIASNVSDYTSSYGSGVDPTRFNYLLGVGVVWNFTSVFRTHYLVKSQKYTSLQLKDDYNLISQQLQDQSVLAETRIANSLKNYNEAPVEVKAASDAYLQKSTLYKNGLSNIVDFTQALYTLNRAQIDRDIAYNNVWQAILFKAAATGDFGVFINNL